MPQSNAKRREVYQERREQILERQRQYWRDHPEKSKEYNRKSYWAHAEDRRTSRKKYYSEHREAEMQRNKEYHEKNSEQIQEQRSEYYAENRDSIKDAVSKRYYDTKSSREHTKRRMLARTKHRAKKDGIPFDLTPDDIVIPDNCPVFGIPFDFESRGKPNDATPSIDKRIPARGYLKGNIDIISYRANRIKSDATLEDLKILVAYLEKTNSPNP